MSLSKMKPVYKPYQQVWVNMGDYQYIGQAMSYCTPQGSVMVRRVPGFTTTLEEISILKLEPVTKPYRYLTIAMVAGPGAFPVDMLRRDNCAPLNFKIDDETSRAIINSDLAEDLWVGKVVPNKYGSYWTIDRWMSFGWVCKPRPGVTLLSQEV